MDLYSLVTNTRTAELILNLSIQIIVVSILGWIIMKLWRPRSATARSAGYLAVLISLAILPVFTAMLNPDRIAWFQSTIELSHSYEPQAGNFPVGTQDPEKLIINNNDRPEILQDTFKENQTSFLTRDRILQAINIFGGVWIAGFIVFFLRLGFKLSFLKGYMHNLDTDNNERLKNIYSSIRHVFNNRPMPKIYFSSSLSSPVTVGILKPVMILPIEVGNITDDELKSILLHELAHIFHGDNFIGVLQHVLSAVFWWNPLIYRLNSAYSDSREDVCDNYAINVLESPKKYATTLLNLAEKTCLFSKMPATTGMSLSSRSLEHRVQDLLKTDRDLSTLYKPTLIIFMLTVAITISYFGLGMRICFKDREDSNRIEYSKESQKADIKYSIDSSPGEGWQERPDIPYNDFVFILSDKRTMIYVAGIPVPEKSRSISAEDFFRGWSEVMQNKYQYEGFKIESSGETTIDGRESYYAVYEFIFRDVMKKEKVYIIRVDSSFYRIRYTGPKNTFNENLQTFEKYARSFKVAP